MTSGPLPTPAPLQRNRSVRCNGLLVDLDGVSRLDERVLPGAPQTLRRVHDRGVPVLFLTNDPRSSRKQYAARLPASGVPTTADQVLTSSRAAAHLLAATEPLNAPPHQRALQVGSAWLSLNAGPHRCHHPRE